MQYPNARTLLQHHNIVCFNFNCQRMENENPTLRSDVVLSRYNQVCPLSRANGDIDNKEITQTCALFRIAVLQDIEMR